MLSYSEVSRDLGVVVNTVKRYLRFLEISYQVVLLRPWGPSVGTRLIKSPKIYWTDPGLARLLAERPNLDDGPFFETYLCDELVRWVSWQVEPAALQFYRTATGREVDFVLHADRGLVAMKAKASQRAHATDARALTEIVTEWRSPGLHPDAWRIGLVVTRGRKIEPLAPHVWAIPDWRLFGTSPDES